MMRPAQDEADKPRQPVATSHSPMSTYQILFAAPKAELHVHLDGSFDSSTLFHAAMDNLDSLPERVRTPWDGKMMEVRSAIRACGDDLGKFNALVSTGKDIKGLFPILDRFYMLLPIVRGRFSLLEELSYEFCRSRAQENIRYTEVRYSPFEFLEQGEDGRVLDEARSVDAVQAVSDGLARGQTDFGIYVRQILCCIASQPSWCAQTVALASEFKAAGVVGVDIAAGEMHFDDTDLHTAHRNALTQARGAGFGVTVHAGEAGPAQNVLTAIDIYGAQRIGHGYRSLGTAAYEYARSRGTHFELCPTSAVATEAVQLGTNSEHGLTWDSHPVSKFCADRTSCSINSDDPAIFQVSLTDELVTCVDQIGIALETIKWTTLEALSHAFHLEPEIRENLEAEVTAYYRTVL